MTNSVSERANAGLWRVCMSLGDSHPGCKADTYCIDKVFISSQLWGHDAYRMLWWHNAGSFHPGRQLCCFYKTWLPFHLMPLPWYIVARGWVACLQKSCGGIVVGGGVLFTSHCCPWWMSFELDKQEKQLQVLSQSHQPFQRFSIVIPSSVRFFTCCEGVSDRVARHTAQLLNSINNYFTCFPSVHPGATCPHVLNCVQQNVVLFFTTVSRIEVFLFYCSHSGLMVCRPLGDRKSQRLILSTPNTSCCFNKALFNICQFILQFLP